MIQIPEQYRYQEQGTAHLLSNPFGQPHALLADSPGTGKTSMSLTAAKKAACTKGIILCPAIIKEQWKHEMVRWGLCAEDEIQVLYGLDCQLDSTPWKVLNYDLVREPRIKHQLNQRKWHSLIMDEAQRLKTHDSQQTLAVFHKQHGIANNCYYKWPLSGTIMPNRPLELYPMLVTMFPRVLTRYNTYPAYIQRYCGGAYEAGKGASNINELTELLQPIMLRRELKDVWGECPPIIENIVWLDVPYEQHPEWIGSDFMEPSTERRVVAEAKIPSTVAYIKDRLESGVNKLVVFSYHRVVIEQFGKLLAKHHPVKVYGGASAKQRQENLIQFQTNPKVQLFLVQISSGGEGLDGLQQVCNELIEAEPEWSPGKEDQAIHRVLRLGQTKPVILTKLLAARSYEQNIYYSNQSKRKVIEVVLKPNGEPIMAKLDDALTAAAEAFLQVMGGKSRKEQPALPAASPPPSLPTAVPPAAADLPPASIPAQPLPPPPQPTAAPSFEDQAIEKAKPQGKAGFERIQQLLTHYGVKGLGDLPAEKQAEFLQYL